MLDERPLRRPAAVLAVFLVLASSIALPVAAAGGSLNWSADGPDVYADANLKISDYRVSDGGDVVYQNDNGDFVEFVGELNQSENTDQLGTGHVNAYQFFVTDVMDTQFGEFPRKGDESDNSASALDNSEYSTSGTAVSDVTTAPNVDAVQFDFSSAGDSATYSNFSVTSDAEKRYLTVAFDIVDASGAGEINLTVHDATDGDTAVLHLYDADGQTSSTNVVANSTGDGKLGQVQLGSLTVSGGDGSIQEIGQYTVSADGAATVEASLIDMEKTSKYAFGTEYTDSDDDDEFETETVYSATGEIGVWSIDSMGSWADDARIKDLTVPVTVPASAVTDDSVSASFSDADQYPSFDRMLNLYVGIQLPSGFDLSYSNVELRLKQKGFGDVRYVTAEYAEGVDESTAFDEISSFSPISLGSAGSETVIDDTVQPGDRNVIHLKVKLTGDEASALQSSGGGSGFFGGGGGGLVDTIVGIPQGIAATVLGLFGAKRRWGS